MDVEAAFSWEYSSSQCPETGFQDADRRPPLSSHSMPYHSHRYCTTELVKNNSANRCARSEI